MFFLSPSLFHSFVHIIVCCCRNSLQPPALGCAVLLCSTMRKSFSNRFWHIFYSLEEKDLTDGETGSRAILFVLRMCAFFIQAVMFLITQVVQLQRTAGQQQDKREVQHMKNFNHKKRYGYIPYGNFYKKNYVVPLQKEDMLMTHNLKLIRD